ncbi:MAG: hypothetical protein E7170_01805 [Firmicutes bacterium]|nr:hypothetical protein [Bacillota bacterium]
MAFNTIEYLKSGKVDFVFELTPYDYDRLIEYVRKDNDRVNIVKGFLYKLMDKKSDFCLNIIYDMEEFKFETSKLLIKRSYSFFDHVKLKNILYNTSWGRDFVFYNLDELILYDNEIIYVIFDYIFEDIDKNKDFISLFFVHKDLHIRYLFMEYVIMYSRKLFNEIYDDITKYLIENPLYEQLSFLPETKKLMDVKDISDLAVKVFCSGEYKTWIMLKEFILNNYADNDLAQKLLANNRSLEKNKILSNEFKKDSDRLFKTSKNFKFSIYRSFSKDVSKELIDDFYNKIKIFDHDGKIKENWKLSSLYYYGLGNVLEKCVDKYLSLSEDQSCSYITSGSMSDCYRIGDYVFKLCNQKWSYEDIICPDLYLILKNLEEYFVRDDKGIVQAGLEVQKYLTRSAKDIDSKYFNMFQKELSRLGYFVNDSLIDGVCGDNCMLLDSYKDADCENPELLPDWFKEYPIVLIDRDRIYEKGKTNIKQLNQRY